MQKYQGLTLQTSPIIGQIPIYPYNVALLRLYDGLIWANIVRVLGIETSCDETGLAVFDGNMGLLAHKTYSQDMHQAYGGVVPELASRDHVRKLIPLIHECLADAKSQAEDIDGIAYTHGPGLIGALLVGASVARSLAYSWQVPALGVHHMEGHLLAPMLAPNPPSYPFLALLVSGGHTLLVEVKKLGQYRRLGESVDDAAGEAFDKVAKMLGLPYPGGPALAKLALKGSPGRFKFPRPMTNQPGLDFSFSGLKTFALNTINQSALNEQDKADIAYAFEEAAIDTLMIKCQRALKVCGLNRLVVAGGVSANLRLREQLQKMSEQHDLTVFFPPQAFCTDNGAMIAYTGYQYLAQGFEDNLSINAHPRLPFA